MARIVATSGPGFVNVPDDDNAPFESITKT